MTARKQPAEQPAEPNQDLPEDQPVPDNTLPGDLPEEEEIPPAPYGDRGNRGKSADAPGHNKPEPRVEYDDPDNPQRHP